MQKLQAGGDGTLWGLGSLGLTARLPLAPGGSRKVPEGAGRCLSWCGPLGIVNVFVLATSSCTQMTSDQHREPLILGGEIRFMGVMTFPSPVYRGESRVWRIVKPLPGLTGDQDVAAVSARPPGAGCQRGGGHVGKV